MITKFLVFITSFLVPCDKSTNTCFLVTLSKKNDEYSCFEANDEYAMNEDAFDPYHQGNIKLNMYCVEDMYFTKYT
jgi:hypothetical protein